MKEESLRDPSLGMGWLGSRVPVGIGYGAGSHTIECQAVRSY